MRLTPQSRDGGRDVILVRGSQRLFVECKTVSVVGEPMLANLYTAVSTGRANEGIFVTTGRFYRDAELRAPQLGIELIDDTLLLILLNCAGQVVLFPEPVD